MNMKVCAKFLLNMLMKIKTNLSHEHKNKKLKLNFFSHNKLNFQPTT